MPGPSVAQIMYDWSIIIRDPSKLFGPVENYFGSIEGPGMNVLNWETMEVFKNSDWISS